MLKTERQEKILELIRVNHLSRQEELTSLLEANGFSVNQSSVSRDLDELGVIKINGIYDIPQKSANRFGLLALETAGENLIVAKTEAGLASAVCVKIDRGRIEEIVGTIAGDDTIFIAVKDAKTQKTAMKRIWEMFEN